MRIRKGHGDTFWDDGYVHYSGCVKVSEMIHMSKLIIHLKYTQFPVCPLYFNKTISIAKH